MDIANIARRVVSLLDEKKAFDTIAYDVRGITTLADYFIISSGSSENHTSFLREEADRLLSSYLTRPYPTPRRSAGADWIVLDYGDIIVHIFTPSTREFYHLEGVWGDAPQLPMDLSEKEEKAYG
jgi:ribosome-associated protein